MTRNHFVVGSGVLALMLAIGLPLAASNDDHGTERLSVAQRRDILRSFIAEPVYIHRVFPMGTRGLRIEDGKVSPSDMEVRAMAAQTGMAVKPGDRAKITDVHFLSKAIVFEINGGPVKKKKWYERLDVSAAGGTTSSSGGPVDETRLYTNAQGSFVLLQFKDHIPALTSDQVRSLLEPVFDFKAGSIAEAYERAMPPKIADAIKNHRALVGMDRDMVEFSKGRPPRRYRDRDGDVEYEEWIYGQPPQQVEFIRFIGDKVARIEVMQVDGQKVVRTANEVGDLNEAMSAMAKTNQPAAEDDTPTRQAPSLMRPGEAPAKAGPIGTPRDGQTQRQLPPDAVPPQLPQGPPIPGADQQGGGGPPH